MLAGLCSCLDPQGGMCPFLSASGGWQMYFLVATEFMSGCLFKAHSRGAKCLLLQISTSRKGLGPLLWAHLIISGPPQEMLSLQELTQLIRSQPESHVQTLHRCHIPGQDLGD